VAGRRLPQAMRKLHAGQGIDIDAEAPMRRLAGDGPRGRVLRRISTRNYGDRSTREKQGASRVLDV
jgi:hypothetical protein